MIGYLLDIRHSAKNSHTQTTNSIPKKRQTNMKRKLKIYLDTSVISALFDERTPERKSLTESFFNEIESFNPSISEITTVEIERTSDPALWSKME